MSVVIPTFNRRTTVVRAVTALLEDDAAREIVVVIDGSHDGTLEALQALDPSEERIRPIQLPENRGRSVARQAGVEAAHGDYVLLLDDDVVAQPGLVTGHLQRQMETSQPTVVLGYMPVVANGDSLTTLLYDREYEGVCRRYERDGAAVLSSLWGGNFSLPRSQCLEVGLVEPGFENRYHEDTDFGLRCKAAGMVGMFDRSLRADHFHERSIDAFLRDAAERGAGLQLLAERHSPNSAIKVAREWPFSCEFALTAGAAVLMKLLLPLTRLPAPVALPVIKILRRVAIYRGAVGMQRQLRGDESSR